MGREWYNESMSSKHLFAFIGSLILILALGGLFLFRDTLKMMSLPTVAKSSSQISQRSKLSPFSPSAISVGPENAKVTVVEFLDFQCPFCKAVHPTLMQLLKEYQGQSVRFVFRHFPLISIHPLALPASNASLCANEQQKFLPYYDLLYTRQDEISSASLVTFAQELGMNLQQFNACMAEKRYESSIRTDVKDGLALGIEGTPTWFINDTRLVGALPYETFKEAIEKALQK